MFEHLSLSKHYVHVDQWEVWVIISTGYRRELYICTGYVFNVLCHFCSMLTVLNHYQFNRMFHHMFCNQNFALNCVFWKKKYICRKFRTYMYNVHVHWKFRLVHVTFGYGQNTSMLKENNMRKSNVCFVHDYHYVKVKIVWKTWSVQHCLVCKECKIMIQGNCLVALKWLLILYGACM